MAGDISLGFWKRMVTYFPNYNAKRQTATVTATTTTTLATLTGLSVPLIAGGSYALRAVLPVTAGSGGGAKVSLDTTDTLALSSMQLTGVFYTASGVATTSTTTFAGGIGSTATCTLVEINAGFVASASGTLVVKGAQNVSDAATTSFLLNGYLSIIRTA